MSIKTEYNGRNAEIKTLIEAAKKFIPTLKITILRRKGTYCLLQLESDDVMDFYKMGLTAGANISAHRERAKRIKEN